MKLIRIVSFIMIIAMLSCMFISCNQQTEEEIPLPERDFYDITVSFQIKNSSGKNIVEAVNYNYKGHEEPTILNIISDYLYIVAEYRCTIDKNNVLQQVGGVKARSGDYWGFMEGVDHDVQAILASSSLQTKYLIDKKMSEYLIEDGGAFTVVLVPASK
jgi:hypothetical protein